ncbi:MAG: Adenosylcobinamide-phosphate guanylyltransferase [Methanoregula sp. SKADARSKE-2]|nr:MAG: Adenosylcobinamide-phosphate guanylyltransferase [Methanoregula sp. SKADARSKE-2]
MLALIMAGGNGSRLNRGEKPLLAIAGRPMISYVIDAFVDAGCEPVVVTSSQTPMTRNWCRAQNIIIHNAKGRGYIEDLIESVEALEEEQPLFISVSDIPCITPGIIRAIRAFYEDSGKDACSTWVPADSATCSDGNMPYRGIVEGIEVCPAGVNIMSGSRITENQDEIKVLLRDACLTINVNTPVSLERAEKFLQSKSRR